MARQGEFGVDETGRPIGFGQTTTGRDTPSPRTTSDTPCPSGQQRNASTGRCERVEPTVYRGPTVGRDEIGPDPGRTTSAPGGPPSITPVTLPGWDPRRTDAAPKQQFGRFVQEWQASGKPWGAEGVAKFLESDPRWERYGESSADDPLIRVRQSELDKWSPGKTSIWQDVIADSGPGGANRPTFLNVYGDPSKGFAARRPSPPSPPGGGGVQPGGGIQSFLGGAAPTPRPPFTPQFPLAPAEFTARYTPDEFTSGVYDRPEQREATSSLIDRMLAETSLSPSVVAQMKEQQKGTLVSGAEQLRQQAIQDASRRGVSPATGQIESNLLGDISKSYRDIDIAKAMRDREEQMGAVRTAQDFQRGLLDQYLGLEGVGYRQFETERARERDIAGEQARVQETDFARWAAQQGIDLNWMRMNMDEDQFTRNFQLLMTKFLAEK